MIRRIRLQNWRAYDQLDLTLTHAVTFLVAPNGVGKSSLIEAVRWGLLGTPDDRNRGRAIRGNTDSASVILSLSIPNSPDIEVTRTLRRKGAGTFAAIVDGESITESEYLATLSAAWLADPSLLDAIIFGPATTTKITGFPIRDHLAALFGIEPMLRAADDLQGRRDVIATRIKALRDDLGGTAAAIADAGRVVAELETAVDAADRRRDAARQQIQEREGVETQAAAWEQYRAAAATYDTRTQTLMTEITQSIASSGDNPREVLSAAQREATAELELSAAETQAAEVRAIRSASAAEILSGAHDQCPTCLRPLSEHERDVALAAHGQETDAAHDTAAEYETNTRNARQRLAAIARFSDAFAQLRPPVEPAEPDPGPDAVEVLRQAREHSAELAQEHGGLLARLEAAQEHLEQLQAAAADQIELTRLAKEDLFLEITHGSLTRLADRYLADKVEPLATQIGHRWKLLFGSDGLQFGADGQIRLGHGDIDLALADLSGGERATALLVTRIMLAASATKTSMMWLDEPLEHLDPMRRATVAQTLVQVAQTGAVGQILITTYEEGLARRLEATAPDTVALTYARTSAPESLARQDL